MPAPLSQQNPGRFIFISLSLQIFTMLSKTMSLSAVRIRRHVRHLSTYSSISISKAKSKLRKEHDPDKAMKIFSAVSEDSTSPVSSRYAQDLTVRRLAKSQRFSDIENFLESQKSDPRITQESFLSALIRSYGRAGMLDHAVRTYEQMDGLGTPRSAVSLNALLSACIQSKLFDKVPEMFDEMPKKFGVVPDKVSYGILVKSFCEMGFAEKALETVKALEDTGVEATAVTYTTILAALYKKGKIEEAENLWKLMLQKGFVDVAAYNVRIMFAHGEDPQNLKDMIDEMNNAGLKPDTISYNSLMTCYLKCGMQSDAMKVYASLKEYGCKPNSATFRTLINHLCRFDDFDEGYTVFKESVRVHKIPDFNTLKDLVEGLVKKKRRKEAKGMMRTMKKKLPPNLLNAWREVEENLGLVSVDASHDDVQDTAA